MDDEEYQLSDSEDDYSKEDKLLLENARSSMRRKEISSDEEVYGFGGSSDEEGEGEEEEDEDEDDMGSDLEDEERAPDERAWGQRKRSFYHTDFVDQDYEGIYQGDEAEKAELEEQEARNIQNRLIQQLNDADFSIHEEVDIAETTESTTKQVIETDLSKLTKRQKLDLVKKESPEFFVLIEDFKQKLSEAQNFLPVIDYFERNVKQSFPALEFLQTKLSIILNYCTNISYYLYLKAKRISIKNHPVLNSLFRYRKILQQMEEVDEEIVNPQVEEILEMIKSGEKIPIDEDIVETKKPLNVLLNRKQSEESKAISDEYEEPEDGDDKMEMDEEIEEEEEEEEERTAEDKRAITYEMAKNKGLTPKRSKVQRNPRVKHRKKYEKAKIRRRGQVRTPRTAIPVYGGEPTGIKIGLTKSIKLKY